MNALIWEAVPGFQHWRRSRGQFTLHHRATLVGTYNGSQRKADDIGAGRCNPLREESKMGSRWKLGWEFKTRRSNHLLSLGYAGEKGAEGTPTACREEVTHGFGLRAGEHGDMADSAGD